VCTVARSCQWACRSRWVAIVQASCQTCASRPSPAAWSHDLRYRVGKLVDGQGLLPVVPSVIDLAGGPVGVSQAAVGAGQPNDDAVVTGGQIRVARAGSEPRTSRVAGSGGRTSGLSKKNSTVGSGGSGTVKAVIQS
jgi:hypothetical protein